MPTIPLLGGMIAGPKAEFVASPPVNLEPVVFPTENGIAEGQLRAMPGAIPFATGPGVDRGAVLWNDTHYRVMGTKLVSVSASGAITELGDVGGTGPVRFDYGFDRLAIRSGEKLFYWNGTALVEVTDPDLGVVKDVIWTDGYFMTTDGTFIVVTELTDPTAVDPRRYGSAEEDPDMIVGLLKFRGEVYALGRHSTEVFQNVGGTVFPFQVSQGATIPYGCISATAKCLFAESFAFVGSARDEALGVYVAGDGTAIKISDEALDDAIAAELSPSAIVLEARTYGNERRLLVHMSSATWVYYFEASRAAGRPIWTIARSGSAYRIRNALQVGSRIICGDTDSAALGILSEEVDSHFGADTEWRFDTVLLYNRARGLIVHDVELTGLPGRAPFGSQSTAFLSFTRDGETWSQERACRMGGRGERGRRLRWSPHSRATKWLGMRFRGVGLALPGFASLEVEVEPLG
ncbi:Bacteriophage P22, Gp10, DNA-stabilising [uncultured Caudovirales phage]|uniref:Bacteriophage P22, Gp10, DNA-stabilising n=1 Tax=uncultured Caudovirales phage TaxID=2100421 RepID=A0A6J5M5U6_9CAUD|nr:Bacteriophage P22, Gp10, DNA-stabilising [uncultured Caudovirales phage]